MKQIKTENDVKALVKQWFDDRNAWHYAPIQNGLGVHGIHDRIGCAPIIVTPDMVGMGLGLFVSIEAKKPGRRAEPDRGMSKHQIGNLLGIRAARGMSICCDGPEDLQSLDTELFFLTRGING